MLDDISSLGSLFDSVKFCGFECGVMSGSAGPTGRPVSLLTFALQAQDWPENPYAFKHLNVLIHVFNAALVVFIFTKTLRHLSYSFAPLYLSIMAGLLWAIWPLQISSVLYVVQRMVLLSSSFVLLSILFYLHFRPRLADDWKATPAKWLAFCIVLAALGLIALLAKESAVLLVVYLLLIELFLFKPLLVDSLAQRVFRRVCLYLPFGVLVAYISYHTFSQVEWLYLAREFTLGERVLSEGRVLLSYLQSLFFPKASALGLYHDAFPKSEGLFAPMSTALSWLSILVMLVAAIFFRKKYVLLSLAILWFFGGHLLEGTILPLELYFEHRNYLPIAMLSLLCVVGASHVVRSASKNYVKYTFVSILAVYLVMLFTVTWSQSSLWGDPVRYGVVQATEHPESIRARSLVVDVYSRLGEVEMAYQETVKMKRDFPRVAGVLVGDVEFACYDPVYTLEPIEELVEKLKGAKFGFGAMVTIGETLAEKAQGKCEAVSVEYLLKMTYALKANPLFKRKLHLLKSYEVSSLTLLGDYEKAIKVYETMSLLPEHWPRYISLLASLDRIDEAIEVAEQGANALKSQVQYDVYYQDILRLKGILLEEKNSRDIGNKRS